MADIVDKELIAYDSMKDQVEREVFTFLDRAGLGVDDYPLPKVSFEKGATMISFPLPALTDALGRVILASPDPAALPPQSPKT